MAEPEDAPAATAVGVPMADAAPLEEYLGRICPVVFDLDDESTQAFRAALADPLTKSKLKSYATEARSPVLVVTRKQTDGARMAITLLSDCVQGARNSPSTWR